NRLPGRFSFVRCEKHSDVFRTRQKSRRELQQLVQNTILPIKCSFRLVRVLESDSALHQEPGHAHLWPVSNPTNISSRVVCSAAVRAPLNPALRDTGQTMSESILISRWGRTCLLSLP